jgi:branched-chain amino acid transport system ATP-binding protein
MNLLSVRNLSKSFGGVQALRDVSFAVAPAEMLAMIGPNGAGKTTCFNLINGQLRPDAGSVFLGQRRIEGLPPRKLYQLGVGRTFQVAATFGSMSVRENLQVVERTPGDGRSILAAVGIENLAEQQCAQLAYGDLKRVELAIALAGRPSLLLMDEPAAGMAAAERRALMELVRKVSRQDGISVLFTEHDMDVVFQYADRVIVLAEGELIAQGAPAEVRADAHVRRVYLGDQAAHA